MPRRKKEKPELIMVIGPNQARAIENYVRRLESLNDDAKAISEDKRELKKEADSEGIDWNTIKVAVSRRKKGESAVALADELLEMYEGALHGLFTKDEAPEARNPNPKPKAPKKAAGKPQADPAQTDIEQITASDPAPTFGEGESVASVEVGGEADVELPSFLRKLAGGTPEPQGESDPEGLARDG